MDGVIDVSRGVVGHLSRHSGWQFLLDLLQFDPHPLDHVDRVCGRQDPDAHEHGFLAGETHFGVVVFGAENDVGDVAQPNERVFVLFDYELFELIRRVEVRVCSQINLQKRAFGAADGRQVVISRKRTLNVARANIQCRHPLRFHPDAHGKGTTAENIRLLHSTDGGQTWLDQTHQIIGHLVRLKNVGCKTKVSRRKLGISCLDCYDRNFRFRREVTPDGIYPGADVGQSFVGVIVQFQTHGDRRNTLQTLRLDVIDSVRRRDCTFQRGGDESTDQFCVGTDVDRRYRDRCDVAARILAHS